MRHVGNGRTHLLRNPQAPGAKLTNTRLKTPGRAIGAKERCKVAQQSPTSAAELLQRSLATVAA
eukprot:1485470-Heterocapsa_arctica.AAC.1